MAHCIIPIDYKINVQNNTKIILYTLYSLTVKITL